MKKTAFSDQQVAISQASTAGPNMKAVEALYLRAKAFEDGQVGSGQRLAVSSEPVKTEEVYQPVATLDAEHRQAFKELQAAVTHGDTSAMKKAFDKIAYIEQLQRPAHQAVREHARRKLVGKVQVRG